MTFKELGLAAPIIKALDDAGYVNPTPIQEQAIPLLIKGQDLLGCAQTGTGKTAAFALPLLNQLLQERSEFKGKRRIKALVISPTRELAIQIGESFDMYAKHTQLRSSVIFGGVKQGAQTNALQQGVDILIATPGRLLDLMSQGFITLSNIKYFVLDEADQMLDMGFIHDIRKVIDQLPKKRQSLFFSATMAPAIVDLSKQILGNPARVTIQPEQTTAERVEQKVFHVNKKNKPKLLIHLLETLFNDATLVFARTKHGADKVVKILKKAGISAEAIHGNKSQSARQRALGNFKNGETKVLIATDIAARGIDVSQLSWVVNFDLPNVPETYVHRIGRTGRAKASGCAISFCDAEQKPLLEDIQRLIKQQIEVEEDHPYTFDPELDPPTSDTNSKNTGKANSQAVKNKKRKPYFKRKKT